MCIPSFLSPSLFSVLLCYCFYLLENYIFSRIGRIKMCLSLGFYNEDDNVLRIPICVIWVQICFS